jgi:soluble lytic murein transglycosylase-like protein
VVRNDLEVYVDMTRQAAINANIDAGLFIRQIQVESNFDPQAKSPAGACGIAQIMPEFHPGVDVWDAEASLNYAANLMREYVYQYNNDYALALAAYNAGPSTTNECLRRGKSYWWTLLPAETIRYLRRILVDW